MKQLINYKGKAQVVLFLVTEDDPHFIHPHTLLIDKEPVSGYHTFEISGERDLEYVFILKISFC